jgi:hypothetical protein
METLEIDTSPHNEDVIDARHHVFLDIHTIELVVYHDTPTYDHLHNYFESRELLAVNVDGKTFTGYVVLLHKNFPGFLEAEISVI